MAALQLATHDPDLFDNDARKPYLDALKELWDDVRKENPALEGSAVPADQQRLPPSWGSRGKCRSTPPWLPALLPAYAAIVNSTFSATRSTPTPLLAFRTVSLSAAAPERPALYDSIIITPLKNFHGGLRRFAGSPGNRSSKRDLCTNLSSARSVRRT